MDKRNFKKPENIERKTEKKDRGDLHGDKQKKEKDKDILDAAPDPGGDTKKHAGVDKARTSVKRGDEQKKPNDQLARDILHNPKLDKHRPVDDAKNTRPKLHRESLERKEKTVCVQQEKSRDIKEDKQKIENKKSKKADLASKGSVKKEEANKSLGKADNGASVSNIEKLPAKHRVKEDAMLTSKASVSKEKGANMQRTPIIKTVTTKDLRKTFKAVTFIEQNQQKTVPLKVEMPSEKLIVNEKKPSKSSASTVAENPVKAASKSILKKKREPKKRRRKFKVSPEPSRVRSPTTEVAKWAPSSVTDHTKPYYEAWVDTTLAAISKTSKRDKLFLEKQNALQNFQRALTYRADMSDLIYQNLDDERYTGRIKVKQR